MNDVKASVIKAKQTIDIQRHYYQHLKEIDFFPHLGQIEPLKLMINSNIKNFFLLCSRNFGKSSLAQIYAPLFAQLYPKSKIYIIAPFRQQVSEIYWASGSMENIIPKDWLYSNPSDSFNKNELRITFKNESFIKFDGADNEATTRGYKPHLLICDEFQDWKQDSWNGMKPNLLAHNATCLLIGTPPKYENAFIHELNTFKKRVDIEKNPNYFYMVRTIYDNPRYPADKVEEMKQDFYDKKEEHVWRREFLAEIILGGANSIFPMFDREKCVRPSEWIDAQVRLFANGLEYYTVLDPSSTRFGVGFYAYNRYTATIYLLDEIIEQDAMRISAEQIKARIIDIENKWGMYNITRIYDEAAKLFALEIMENDFGMISTEKKHNDKSNNISLLKDIFLKGKIFINESCKMFVEDIVSYHTNEKGRIVKERDEGVDCTLYMIAEAGYSFNNLASIKNIVDPMTRQPYTYLKREPEKDPFDMGRKEALSFNEDDLWS